MKGPSTGYRFYYRGHGCFHLAVMRFHQLKGKQDTKVGNQRHTGRNTRGRRPAFGKHWVRYKKPWPQYCYRSGGREVDPNCQRLLAPWVWCESVGGAGKQCQNAGNTITLFFDAIECFTWTHSALTWTGSTLTITLFNANRGLVQY